MLPARSPPQPSSFLLDPFFLLPNNLSTKEPLWDKAESQKKDILCIFVSIELDYWIKYPKKIKEMIVERLGDELLVRIPANMQTSRIQNILDYLRYEELTSESSATEEDVNMLVKEIKKGRWNKVKKELGLKWQD